MGKSLKEGVLPLFSLTSTLMEEEKNWPFEFLWGFLLEVVESWY